MPLRSRFAKQSSISGRGALPALLVSVTVVAAAIAGIGVAVSSASVAAIGLVVATTFAGAFSVYLIVSERRRHEFAEDELQGQARFLESLVRSMAVVADSSRQDDILDRTCAEARTLFGARSAEVVPVADGEALEAREIPGGIRVPVSAGDEPIGMLELRRADPFPRVDLCAPPCSRTSPPAPSRTPA